MPDKMGPSQEVLERVKDGGMSYEIAVVDGAPHGVAAFLVRFDLCDTRKAIPTVLHVVYMVYGRVPVCSVQIDLYDIEDFSTSPDIPRVPHRLLYHDVVVVEQNTIEPYVCMRMLLDPREEAVHMLMEALCSVDKYIVEFYNENMERRLTKAYPTLPSFRQYVRQALQASPNIIANYGDDDLAEWVEARDKFIHDFPL